MTEIALIVGRVLFSLLFINSGIAHFTKNSAMTGYAQYKKVPLAKVSVYVSGVMILLGGLYILLGFYADFATAPKSNWGGVGFQLFVSVLLTG